MLFFFYSIVSPSNQKPLDAWCSAASDICKIWFFLIEINNFLDFEKDFGVCLDAVQLVVTAWLDLRECGHSVLLRLLKQALLPGMNFLFVCWIENHCNNFFKTLKYTSISCSLNEKETQNFLVNLTSTKYLKIFYLI